MGEPEKPLQETSAAKTKVLRCMDWLQKQNSLEPKKSLQNQNDIQFIIQTNADRKSFLLSAAEDEASVPAGVGEPAIEPKAVNVHKLRLENLSMECDWQSCKMTFNDYCEYQKHVRKHLADLHVIDKDRTSEYVCLWGVCGHKTADFNEMIRHMNYHSYHGKLLAIGLNGRATLKLVRCKKDSSKRNHIPVQRADYSCMWVGCDMKFNSFQQFLDHVKQHTNGCAESLTCSWAGCGSKFNMMWALCTHVRSHTGERQIACYHCGMHFSNNRKLCDHLRRQNVYPSSPYICTVCGTRCATEYLLNEHARQHVSLYACSLCDMSAPTPGALARHTRYRHLPADDAKRHKCLHCEYKAVTRWDLQQHILRHQKRIKKERSCSDEENSDVEVKKPKTEKKKYACHMCPEKEMKIFSRGSRLTMHLVKVHGAQWPFGHSRFRYQISEDGMYRLTTTRFESLEVSRKIVDGYSDPKESLNNTYQFKIQKTADATETTPKQYEITLKNDLENESENVDIKSDNVNIKSENVDINCATVKQEILVKNEINDDNAIEITMMDVDEEGNIISSEVISCQVSNQKLRD